MHEFPFILASGDDPTIKIVVWVVIGIIWGISTLVKKVAGAASKQQQQQQARTAAPPPVPEAAIDLTPLMDARAAPLPVMRAIAPPPLPPMAKQRPPSQKGRRGTPARKQPQPAARPTLPPAPPITPVAAAPAPARVVSPSAAPTTASNLRSALRADALRRQVVITEILRKPLALRSESPD